MNKKIFLVIVSIASGGYNSIRPAQPEESLARQIISLYDTHPNDLANELTSFLKEKNITGKEARTALVNRKYNIHSISLKKLDRADNLMENATKVELLTVAPLYALRNRVWQTQKTLNLDKIPEIYPKEQTATTLQQLFKTYSPLEKFYLFVAGISFSSIVIALGSMAYIIYESIEKNEVKKIDKIISILESLQQ